MEIVNNVEINKDYRYKFENLEEKELLFYLTSIDTKFSAICDLINSIDKDLELVKFEHVNTYRCALETLKSTVYVFSDFIFSAIDKNNLLEDSRIS